MEIEVTTGFGYMKDAQGNITDKAVLRPGTHQIRAGFTYHEVEDEAELDAVQVYRPAKTETPAQTRRRKIDAEIDAMAIERLTARGEL